MFRFGKPEIENFRADYAKHADFCEIFEKDIKRLYLLAFLLTADHKQAEQCFASTVEEAFKKPTVFKEWARSWVNRTLIEKRLRSCPLCQTGQTKKGIRGAQGYTRTVDKTKSTL
jgi:hypothetical protein